MVTSAVKSRNDWGWGKDEEGPFCWSFARFTCTAPALTKSAPLGQSLDR